jgi:hypothetical protein
MNDELVKIIRSSEESMKKVEQGSFEWAWYTSRILLAKQLLTKIGVKESL